MYKDRRVAHLVSRRGTAALGELGSFGSVCPVGERGEGAAAGQPDCGGPGETLALSALGRYLRRDGRGWVSELQYTARELGALSVIRPAVEAVLA
jgi:hypothetical protein